MRHVLRVVLALAVGLLVAPAGSWAAPISYYFTSGWVNLTVTTGPTTLLAVPGLPIDGDYVTFDAAVPELTDIRLELNAAGPYGLSAAYNGYDTVSVAGVVLEPVDDAWVGPDYSGPATLQLAGPPVDNYSYTGGPLKVTGTLTASDSTLVNHPLPLIAPFNIPNPAASGTLLVNTVTGNIALLGVTIGVVPASGSEPFPLVIKGDFFFKGVVPEPGTAILLGVGVVGLLALGRRARA